jgi:hypothetical protein
MRREFLKRVRDGAVGPRFFRCFSAERKSGFIIMTNGESGFGEMLQPAGVALPELAKS